MDDGSSIKDTNIKLSITRNGCLLALSVFLAENSINIYST